jgi:methyltransferase (TIGR00027 family)
MDANQPSRSAMSAAVARGTHRLWDDPPWLLDDPFALVLVGPVWEAFAAASRALARLPVWRQGHAGVLVRSRYPEDRLLEGQYTQYVVLSAGLDSFAWRRPDLMRSLHLFEVDHPATQAWKPERAVALALPMSECHTFVPVDFETQNIGVCLDAAGFDWSCPTHFSWVGSTMYLTKESIATTLRLVAACAPGSEIVLSYNQELTFVDDIGHEFLSAITPRAAEIRESVLTSFAPAEMEEFLKRCGLEVVEHPTSDDLFDRYCAGRTDGLRPYTLERLISARRLTESFSQKRSSAWTSG